MKPGNIKTDVGHAPLVDRARQVEEAPKVEPRVELEVPLDGRSQLPESPSSRADSSGESALVQAHIRARQDETRKGKRQKFLKVAEAKTLAKAAKAAFKALADLLTRAATILGRLRKKLLDDDEDEGEQQRRRRHHEEAIEDVQDAKIEPSEVPRGLKPLTT